MIVFARVGVSLIANEALVFFQTVVIFLLYLFNGNVKSHQPHLNLAHFPLNTTRATQRFASYLCARVFVYVFLQNWHVATLRRAIYHGIFQQ